MYLSYTHCILNIKIFKCFSMWVKFNSRITVSQANRRFNELTGSTVIILTHYKLLPFISIVSGQTGAADAQESAEGPPYPYKIYRDASLFELWFHWWLLPCQPSSPWFFLDIECDCNAECGSPITTMIQHISVHLEHSLTVSSPTGGQIHHATPGN